MSSLFDSWVASRRKNTPYTEVSKISFLKTMAQLEGYLPEEKHKALTERGAVLRICPRPDVASRLWFTVEWTGPDGKRHYVQAQELDLVFWRAVQSQIQLEDKEEGKAENANVPIPLPIPMILNCPECGKPHIDEGEWKTKLHRTHKCEGCGKEWQAANWPTVGVHSLPPEEQR